MPMVAFDHLGTRERENAVGPFVLDKDPLQVQFHVNRIKPGLPVVLPLLFFEFTSFDNAAPFAIRYTLVSKNMRGPESGSVHVKVKRRADQSDA